MDNLIEKLKKYGADIDGAMRRFLDDTDLYKTCFYQVLSDSAFTNLYESIEKKEYAEAFDYAHTLKGIVGNMGLTPLYDIICLMVEDLRKNEYSKLQYFYQEITKQMNALKSL